VRERLHGVLVLRGDVERLATRDHELQVRARGKKRRQSLRGLDHVLEVVEEQKQAPVADVPGDVVVASTERLAGGREDERGFVDGRQRHPPHAVREVVGRVSDRLGGEPRLAGAAGTGESQQADVGTRDLAGDLVELPLAADERRRRDWEVRQVQRPERRMASDAELVQALGCREVLEAVRAEVEEVGVDEGGRGLGDQYLGHRGLRRRCAPRGGRLRRRIPRP
jgi:hypothetical protein